MLHSSSSRTGRGGGLILLNFLSIFYFYFFFKFLQPPSFELCAFSISILSHFFKLSTFIYFRIFKLKEYLTKIRKTWEAKKCHSLQSDEHYYLKVFLVRYAPNNVALRLDSVLFATFVNPLVHSALSPLWGGYVTATKVFPGIIKIPERNWKFSLFFIF